MKLLRALTVKLTVIVFVIVISSPVFHSTAHRPSRRSRPMHRASDSNTSGADDYASRAIIGRVNSSGHAALSPRAREIINNQNARERKDSLGGYADLNMIGEEMISAVNCSTSCTPREALKRIRVETIKMDILKKLRISTLPNMTNQRVPDIPLVRNLIDRNQQNDAPFADVESAHDLDELFAFDSEHSTTLRTIIFPLTGASSSSSSGHHRQFCQFALQSKVFSSKEIINATFGVYVRRTGSEDIAHPVLPAFLFLHRVKADGKTDVYLKKRIPTWSTAEGHWIHFDIKHVAQEWLARPSTNHGLKVVVDDSQGRFRAIVNPHSPDEEPHKPFLDVSVREKARSRSRRSLGMTCEERSSERRCCRYPLIIDFEAFRWDWIIAPRSYHAYYCSGECPFTYFQRFPHTHVVQQFRADGRNGGPCCSPRDLSPISLLYFDTHMNIISGVLPGMVVNRCSCA